MTGDVPAARRGERKVPPAPSAVPSRVERKRLLIVVNVGWFFLSHRSQIADAATKHGYDVHVACAIEQSVEAQAILSAGHHFHKLTLKRSGRSPFGNLWLFLQLLALYVRLRPNVIHLVSIKPVIVGGLAARLVSKASVISAISGLGYVFTARSVGGRVTRAIVRAAYRVALAGRRTTVLFQNADDLAVFVNAGIVSSNRTALIRGSGVDLDQFRPSVEPQGKLVVLLPARMLRDKGIIEFLDAARLVHARGLKARFVLVGAIDPENRASISKAQLEREAKAAGVEWWGQRSDMPAVFALAHIVCLPSYREGLPKALLEAAACGRPLVATDVPGCREICREGDTGLLVPPRDSVALANALERLILDQPLRLRLGRRAREVCVSEFGVESVVEATMRLYEGSRLA